MRIHEFDNVEMDLSTGHKHALCDIKCGENVIKYGNPIGHATEDIKKGDHVHSHNTIMRNTRGYKRLLTLCGTP